MTRGASFAAARKLLVAILVISAAAAAAYGLTYLISSSPSDLSSVRVSASVASSTKAKRNGNNKSLWADLTPAQQEALAPLASEWDQISAVRRKKWLELGNKIAVMPPEERQKMQERIRDWVKLTPEQRRQARANYAQTRKQLKPEEKKAQWLEYQKLPEEKKRELAEKIERAKQQIANPPQKNEPNGTLTPPLKSPPKPDADKSTQPAVPAPAAPPTAH